MGFQQGLSGLNTSSKALDVVGNNIANSQTVGFKAGQAQFADVFSASLSGAGSTPVGIGARVATVVQQFTQGNISVTNNPLDTAINGGGFFQMADESGSVVYTRNGQFQLDQSGYIVNSMGLKLMGKGAVDGAVGGETKPLRLFDPTTSLSGVPQATGTSQTSSGVQANLNLDSREGVPASLPFNVGDPTTYNKSTSVTIYDTLGEPHTLSLYFVRAHPSTGLAYQVRDDGLNATTVVTDAANNALLDEIANPVTATAAQDAANAVITEAGNLYTALAAISDATSVDTSPTPADAVASSTDAAAAAALVKGFEATAKTAARAAALLAGATLTEATDYAEKAVAAVMAVGAEKTANKWNVYAAVGSVDLSNGGAQTLNGDDADYLRITDGVAAATPDPVLPGMLQFDRFGNLSTAAMSMAISSAQLGNPNGIEDLLFDVNLGGSTQYGAPFAVNALVQDGYSSGALAGFNIGSDGTVLGRYTNGQTTVVGQIELVAFRNPQALQPKGDNVWAQAPGSGPPIPGNPGASGQYGNLQSASIEDANIDLTAELVTMIVLQRVYQANAQTIKTQDQVLQTLVNMR